MPFTLSHPAAVLPFGGRGAGLWVLALPPLVAGIMAPDVPYYTPLPGSLRGWTHSFAGAFTIDVVLAVALWYTALAMGALTHVAWDAFTHPDGQVVTRVPAMSDVVAGHPMYQWLQWGSTVSAA